MKQESVFEKIVRKTGMKQRSCKCQLCKSQCSMPCKGTPEDVFKLIGAGYASRLMQFDFMGVRIIAPLLDKQKNSCTFFSNGLCELHESGLKPTEGKLSHHSTTGENFNYKKSLTFHIMKEWKNITDKQAKELVETYIKPSKDQEVKECDASKSDQGTKS